MRLSQPQLTIGLLSAPKHPSIFDKYHRMMPSGSNLLNFKFLSELDLFWCFIVGIIFHAQLALLVISESKEFRIFHEDQSVVLTSDHLRNLLRLVEID